MRKTKLISLALFAAAWLAGSSAQAWDEPAQVDGVYQIGTASELEWFAEAVNAANADNKTMLSAQAVLTADIDMTGIDHAPIGASTTYKFEGKFDGQFHTISNLVIDRPDAEALGLFGVVRGNAKIKNIIMAASCSIRGKNRVGSIVGLIQTNTGASDGLEILNCVSYATLTTTSGAAGMIGAGADQYPYFDMENCVNAGTVNAVNKGTAFCGWNKSAGGNAKVWNCLNTAEIKELDTGSNGGQLFRGSNRSVANCYDTFTAKDYGKYQGEKPTYNTTDPLHSGEICYLLNTALRSDLAPNANPNAHPFTQDLSDPNSIPLPVPGKAVYQVAALDCAGNPKGGVAYSNEEGGSTRDDHTFDPATGLCTYCSYPKEDWLSANADGFYYLGTPAQVEWFSHMVKDAGHGAMNVKLTADIDFGGVADAHLPIGTNTQKYFGHFDGQGHRIKGMVLTTANDLKERANDGQGFFGSLSGGGTDADGTDKNEVIIENLYIDASCSVTHDQNFVAGVVGRINGRKNESSVVIIRNCGNEANVTTTGKNAAGILGCVVSTNVGLKLYNLWNKGTIVGQGGESAAICAWTGQRNTNGEVDVEGCWNIGEVTGIDVNHYNMIRRNTAIVPRNIVDLCIANGTNGGNQGVVSVWNTGDPISSGELCYLLNGDQTNIVYTQTLDTDAIPIYGTTSAQVYQAGTFDCAGAAVSSITYNNVSDETIQLDHVFADNGICSVCQAYQEPSKDGENYYLLTNIGKVKWFENAVNNGEPAANAKLMVDLDFDGGSCRIGNGANSYCGTFKGNDHVISNFNITTNTESVQGFFGWITGGADISGIIFDNSCSISCVAKAGIIGGAHNGGTIKITRLGNEGNVTTQNERASGIIGTNDGTACVLLIDQCYSTGTISGNSNCSQIAAYTGENSKVTNSWACSNITKGANTGREFSDYSGSNHEGQYENCFTTYHETNNGLTFDTPMTDFGSGKVAYATGFGQNIGTDDYPGFFGPEVLFVGTAGYTTFYDSANDWKLNGDAQAYIGTISGNYLNLGEIDDIPAGTAVVIGGTYYNKLSTTATASTTGNILLGSDGTQKGGTGIYALANGTKGVGFYPVGSEVTIPKGKAYLVSPADVKGFTFVFDDDATGIENIEHSTLNIENSIYDLSGRRINSQFTIHNSQLPKGIYIVNGKKILK